MSIHPLLGTSDQLEREIQKDVIEIRQRLPAWGYHCVTVFKEQRQGRIFSAVFETGEIDFPESQAIATLRVSAAMQSDGNSLVTQATQILDLARERHTTIHRFYLDAGISGAESKRPAFQAAMRAATGGQHRALYTYDLYRFYRDLRGLANNYHLLMEHGVDLVSVAVKNTNLNSRDGKLLIYLKGIMGELYLDDLSRTVTDNKAKRAMQGYSNASIPPFGYCRGMCFQCADTQGEGYCPRFGDHLDLWREVGSDPKVFVPHPVDQHAFRIAAELSATGDFSDRDIARLLSRPLPAEMASLDLSARTAIKPLEGGLTLVQLENESLALQHADGTLQFFRPKGKADHTDPNRRFDRDAVRDMLQNPFYAGFVVYRATIKLKGRREQQHRRFKMPLSDMNRMELGTASLSNDHGMLFPGLHVPLIEVSTFETVQEQRGLRGFNASNAEIQHRIYPLSGVLKCARCGESFRGNAGNGAVRYYEDGSRARGLSDCPNRLFRAEPIEEMVFEYVQNLRIPEDWYENILFYLREGEPWEDLQRERRAVQSRLSAGREMLQRGIISMGEYDDLAFKCQQKLNTIERKMRSEDSRYQDVLGDFSRLWEVATEKERKGLIRCIFSRILFQDGEMVEYKVREPFRSLFPDAGSGASGQVDDFSKRLAQPTPAGERLDAAQVSG